MRKNQYQRIQEHQEVLRNKIALRKDITPVEKELKFYKVQLRILYEIKMPQSGVGSMQGKDTGNMPSAVCASPMNKSLDPTPI